MSRNASASSRRSVSASVVLRDVLAGGPVARSTIARRTGLSPSAVTGHITELAAFGLVRELDEATRTHRVGRPHVPVDIDTAQHVVAGIHVAVPHTTVALLDLRGRVLLAERLPHHAREPLAVLERAADRLLAMLEAHAPERSPVGLGVATGGWVDQASGVIVEHPVLGWRDVAARDLLAGRTGLAVEVDGHSRALIHAERLFGVTRESVLQLFVGNVVDAAFATAGTVQHGPRSAAGAVAHLPVEGSAEPCSCGRAGCLQATVSEHTLARRALAGGILDQPSFPALLALAEQGSPAAVALFRERARVIGRAAVPLVDLLNPDALIVVEPGISRVPGCLAALRAELAARSWVCDDPEHSVLPTSFPRTVLASAAGAVLLTEFYQDPLRLLTRRLRRTS
ncbi:ROK family protein [Amycolatopsis acidiphila]|uniref:ROK family protein n=1 Tax=Amycolatopsis acidiphila TaxID=715473 RepID=A0A558A8C4_9PSEU|nr:ROK family protein [Amycolatopsis acidiphila]TVT20515.1 ROK family protein [Amycolatopsis acidiphila]UIJ57040.1 ROK family protein [Amycolatopsis acidiphila]GHG53701.1 sugar kinase [Amycolatopsis acidiphila]